MIECKRAAVDGFSRGRRETLSYDPSAAAHCGNIAAVFAPRSKAEGASIGVDDLDFAARARRRGLARAMNDMREFQRAPGAPPVNRA